ELRMAPREVLAPEDAALAECGVDLCHAAPGLAEVDDELLEEPAVEEHADPGDLADLSRRVVAALEDRAADVAKALRAHQRHVDGVRDRPEVHGVPGPVLALLSRAVRRLLEEDHAEGALARLDRVAERDLQRRVLPRVALLVTRRDEPAGAAPTVHVNAERLGRADDDVRAPGARRREHAEADRVDTRDGRGPPPHV